MKMHALSGGRLRMRRSIFVPEAARGESIELPVSCFLLRHPRGNVLFDTGCHPSVATDAEARWGGLARVMEPIAPASENVVAGLEELGLACDDIDIVVCSHLHPDHCGCNSFFRRAEFICHAADLAAAQEPDAVARGFLPGDYEPPTPFRTIEAEHDLFGDGRVVLVPVPGHTPGSTGARVALDRDGVFFLAADAVSVMTTLTHDVIPKNTWNAERALESVREIQRMAAAGATVLCGHDDAQWATLRRGADAYE